MSVEEEEESILPVRHVTPGRRVHCSKIHSEGGHTPLLPALLSKMFQHVHVKGRVQSDVRNKLQSFLLSWTLLSDGQVM